MLTFTARLTVKAGQEQEFERIMSIAVPKVREEPGNQAIFSTALRKTRVSLCFTKSMMIRQPWRRHRAHLRDMGIDLRALLDGPPIIEFYEKLA